MVTNPGLPGDPDARDSRRLSRSCVPCTTIACVGGPRPKGNHWAPAIAPVLYVRLAPFAVIALGHGPGAPSPRLACDDTARASCVPPRRSAPVAATRL